MKIKFDAAFKNRRVVAVIVVGAIVVAIPIFIFWLDPSTVVSCLGRFHILGGAKKAHCFGKI
jgi:hypothetical protein